jgi:hypothetical protein
LKAEGGISVAPVIRPKIDAATSNAVMGIKMDALKKWLRANPSNKQMISNATAFNPQQIEILDGF